MFAYVGSRTTRERNARGEGLSVYAVDPASAALERIQLLGDLVNPSYLALNHDGSLLYAVHGDRSEVSAFRVDRASGRLTHLHTQDTQGRNPVHLALTADGGSLLLSNHLGDSPAGGTLVRLPVGPDGRLEPVAQRLGMPGPIGPHRVEQPHAKPHFNPLDPAGRFVLVPDKGLDRVFSFAVGADGSLGPEPAATAVLREGSGPRHLACHPSLPMAYVVGELDSSVTACRYDAATGALQPCQVLPSLPEEFTGNSRAAGIAVDAAGHTLYLSNRGHDSIAAWRIDATAGRLRWLGATPSGGRTPRFFTLTPDGRWMFVLNEDSDSLVLFAVDPATGALSDTGTRTHCGSPVCMVFSQ